MSPLDFKLPTDNTISLSQNKIRVHGGLDSQDKLPSL